MIKKKLFATIGAMVVAGGIGVYFSQSDVVKADPNYTQEDIRKQVTDLYPGKITELELEREGNKAIYEVEIELEGKEFELKIDGNNGEVLKLEEKLLSKMDSSIQQEEHIEKNQSTTPKESEQEKPDESTSKSTPDSQKVDDTKTDKSSKQETTPPQRSSKKTVISMDEAKSIALANFSGTIVELELDEDDDRLLYELELVNGNREAEIEIDAYTGNVLVLEIETEDDDSED